MSLPDSDDEILLLHNPRCSKSRATQALLEEQGVAFTPRLYLEEPLSREELEELGQRLSRSPSEWIRTGQREYGEAGLSGDAPADELLAAMAEHPVLMERPIVVRGKRAVVGRPPTNVLELL
jgi:arsenate reductase